jgi:pimeloyl-ACP methyl ester carboxylesterase
MKNIFSIMLMTFPVLAGMGQGIPYGNNPETGKYFDSDGEKLYYEIYGKGDPVLLLHGGVFGYISEFEMLIPRLAENHMVICLATRGHGKSEIGHEPFTYSQRARDAYNLIRHLNLTSVKVVGFSDGGFAALEMAADYPEAVNKVVAMGVGDHSEKYKTEEEEYTANQIMSQAGQYFEGMLKLMPEPDRWDESLKMINKMYKDDHMSSETFGKINCEVLLINGDGDQYNALESLLACYREIAIARLAVIPKCGHVILYCNFPAVWECMKNFID